jgi:archaetidylinositol phosphate synthase
MLGKVFRKPMQKFLENIAKHLRVNPNYMTVLVYPFSLITFYLIATKQYLLSLPFFIISSFLDNLDGAIAKYHKTSTPFGNYLDGFTDKVQEFLILFAFAISGYWFESFIAFSLGFFCNFAKTRAEMVKPLGNIDWPGIGERAERLSILFLSILTYIFYPYIFGFDTIKFGLYVVIFISFIGTLQRFYFAYQVLSDKRNKS